MHIYVENIGAYPIGFIIVIIDAVVIEVIHDLYEGTGTRCCSNCLDVHVCTR